LPAGAFEPQTHAMFCRDAARIYQACTGHVVSTEWIARLTEGSVHEDDLSLERVLNWHFYNNDGKIGKYWKYFFYCHGSNERIFKRRLETLDRLIAEKKSLPEIYTMAGRIVHHIQDMSSPPHVMPIYHVGSDRFDKYKSASGTLDAEICSEMQAGAHHPLDLLENAAQNTLKAVNRSVVFDGQKTFENETWLKFWGGPEDENLVGFRTYGLYGNVFGESPCNSGICLLYNKRVYDDFFGECSRRAITDTVRFLMYLDERIGKGAGK